MPSDGSFRKRLPNLLTLLRFLLVPLFVVLLESPSPSRRFWATVVFVAASLTDWLDGYLARLYNAESILGKLLDPLADKVLVMAALVMLAAAPSGDHVPAWMVVVLLGREMIITGLRSVAAIQGIVVAASRLAKHKTAWTMGAVVLLLIGSQTINVFGTTLKLYDLGMFFLWVALVLSVASGLSYAVQLRKTFI